MSQEPAKQIFQSSFSQVLGQKLLQHGSNLSIIFYSQLRICCRINQALQFRSTSKPQTVVSPSNCLMAGLVHPPNEVKSENEGDLSQWAYQMGESATEGQADLFPNMLVHIKVEEQIPTPLPLDLTLVMMSVRNWQLLLASWPLHEHPALGLVSTSIHTFVYKLPEIPAIISSTCAVALLPRHGNMYISVANPTDLALVRL